MGRNRRNPPHKSIIANARWRTEQDAREAALEAKYGVPYDKIPSILTHGAPEHPQRDHARRYDYVTMTGYRFYSRHRRDRRAFAASDQIGWRRRRANFLAEVERVRQAEIEVRKMHIVRGGRGKIPAKNVRDQAKNAVEKRELREGAW